MSASRFDDVSRVLASPADLDGALTTLMPRRRALRILAVGFGAAFLPGAAPRRARAADPPPPCSSSGGRFCGNVNPLGKKGYNIGCCLGAPGETRTVCCPGIPGVVGSLCCPTGYTCGNTSANSTENCKCSGVVCGGRCCPKGQYCETRLFDENTCDKLCPVTNDRKCIGVCCTANETCGFFGCKCKPGLVSTGGGTCVEPREDPGDPTPGYNPFRNMFKMMGQSSAASGGAGSRAVFGRSAQSGPAGVDAALGALAAVNGQGAAAMLAIRGGARDGAFKRRVRVARVKPPTLFAGPGLDAGSAAALNRLLVAEARAHALIAAMATALWRARAAHAKRDRVAAKRQFLASATFAAQAVTALKRLPGLRAAAANALTAGKVAEVLAFDEEVNAFAAAVQSGGIPEPLRASMGALGVTDVDLRRLRAGVLEQAQSSAVGPVLIAPLRDPARAAEAKTLITALSDFSRRARRHRLAR